MKNTLATTLIQHTSPAPGRKTGGSLVLTALLLCGLVLVCGTAQAQSPKLVCSNVADAWGTPAAVTATTGTVSDEAAGYFVAATADESGYLEVKAFQNNCKEVGHVHTDDPVPIGAPITAVAAADLNSSQIVTAVVDKDGTLVYDGAIDDHADPFHDPRAAKNYVSIVVHELRAGSPVTVAQTKPYGCAVHYEN